MQNYELAPILRRAGFPCKEDKTNPYAVILDTHSLVLKDLKYLVDFCYKNNGRLDLSPKSETEVLIKIQI